MAVIDVNYHNLLKEILNNGYDYDDPNRTGVVRRELLNYTFRHEFKDGFPAITTKKLNYKSVVTELIWFLRGDTNIKYLVDNGCNIWNKDAYNYYNKLTANTQTKEEFERGIHIKNHIAGELGPVYGAQWRKWEYQGLGNITWFEDQIQRLIKNLKEKPLATDHIVNAWNVGDLQDMALPPCHYGFQIVVRPLNIEERSIIWNNTHNPSGNIYTHNQYDENEITKYGFELHWQQRSVDTFLGLPFNISSYATLALSLEEITGYKALAIQGDLKKVHLYDNSFDAVKEQLSRDVNKYGKCELNFNSEFKVLSNGLFNNKLSLNDFVQTIEIKDFKLENYESYPHIKVEMLERDE